MLLAATLFTRGQVLGETPLTDVIALVLMVGGTALLTHQTGLVISEPYGPAHKSTVTRS
jgi:hypothetical protein